MKKSFDQELYIKIPINNLILFCIYLIVENNKSCGFERLIKECFTLFPKKFGFSQYSQWPDSRKLDSALRVIRSRKLIIGDPKTFFSLTKTGRKTAKEITSVLKQKKLKFT